MDWFQAVDIYCERTAPGFWNEPINAISNASFILAALWGAYEARKRGISNPVLWVLILLAAMIGTGSFLFHTYANRWSELADVGPIWTFVAIYILMAMRWLGGMKPGRVGAIFVGVAAVVVVAFLAMGEGDDTATESHTHSHTHTDAHAHTHSHGSALDWLNGSEQYAPALLALLFFSFLTWRRQHRYRHWVWGATLAFVISLTFRTIDPLVCNGFPIGSHFVWHLMNGAMIAALIQLLIRTIDDAQRAPSSPSHPAA